ncbi:MAG: winged helix-turn-helix transcriptional regulator [Candidatus Lokiarchaeota archaeon]|nr:winged helix-turn-helix transcriptional regulator [Candidatus Lokiarchaeota archaeon]
MISQSFRIDEIDQKIVRLIQQEPNLTHTEIATHVSRSQPTVGMRIRKLEDSGVLQFQAGISMQKIDLYFAKVDILTNKPETIMNIVKSCPFLINAFRTSGDFNLIVLVASFQIEDLDKIINYHIRNNKDVVKVNMEIITDVADEYLIPLNIIYEECCCH